MAALGDSTTFCPTAVVVAGHLPSLSELSAIPFAVRNISCVLSWRRSRIRGHEAWSNSPVFAGTLWLCEASDSNGNAAGAGLRLWPTANLHRLNVTLILFHIARSGWQFSRFGPFHDAICGLGRVTGAIAAPIVGRWGTTIPHKVSILLVIGSPIPVPHLANPDHTTVQQYLGKFIECMERLFEQHKAEAGTPDLKLQVL